MIYLAYEKDLDETHYFDADDDDEAVLIAEMEGWEIVGWIEVGYIH